MAAPERRIRLRFPFSPPLLLPKVTIAQHRRLLFMGSRTVSEYESLDSESLPGETQAGGFKHNGAMGSGTGNLSSGQQTRRSGAMLPTATMPNDLLIQPDTESQAAAALARDCELDVTFGIPIEEKPIWAGLYESLLDVFFPTKLPPLELTSTPVPVPDPMAFKRNPWAAGAAFLLNGSILVLMIIFGLKTIIQKPKVVAETPITLSEYKPQAAGGGGGAPDKTQAIQGKIPPRMKVPEIAPKIVQPPPPTINVQQDIAIPDDTKLPNFGMASSTNVKLASSGSGSGIGMGPGNGSGYGPGAGGNYGGGVYRVGGAVSAPEILHSVQAEFSDEARRNKYQGVCIVEIIVDAQGNPHNPRVVRALGEGLDENAIKAILQYKFRPGYRAGKPVATGPVDIEIDFHLY